MIAIDFFEQIYSRSALVIPAPNTADQRYLKAVSGIVGFTYSTAAHTGFTGDTLQFIVPQTNAGVPFNTGPNEILLSTLVFPAVAEVQSGGGPFGWGVNTFFGQIVPPGHVELTATLVVEGNHTFLLRVGFQILTYGPPTID